MNTGTVLIVEDQKGLAEAYTTVISTVYETKTATSGEEALEKVDDTVDVVILDRRMPGMSGDKVLAEFIDRGISATVAMLTAVEPDVDILEMPFDDYVTKPIDNEELITLVETLIERGRHTEQIQQYFRLEAKKSALEDANRDTCPEYEGLIDEMHSIQSDLDTAVEGIRSDLDPRERFD